MQKAVEANIVRTRFAPSPSGHLHVGGARTALFCWAYAKKRGGKFILRIEDTDQKRSSESASLGFLADLKWLGIDWDEGPKFEGFGGGPAEVNSYFQSERLAIYNEVLERMIAEGTAYRAFETQTELEAARAQAKAEKRAYRYDRGGLKLAKETVEQHLKEGRAHVVRFKVPDDKEVRVQDEALGEVVTRAGEIDDFVIRKADGYPTYHFAVVVDDELMGVTHVIRAQEHLNNTAKHVLLQDALGYRRPVYAHISVITNPDGSKMSKRDKDRALRTVVRERGMKESPKGSEGQAVVGAERWMWWLSEKDHQLGLEEAERLAQALGVNLPEINVDDFRRNGYLPDVMVNYLALLGWSPGEQREKFDRVFFVERFDFDRVIKSPAKFDREKLLAFNLDAIQAMSKDEFAEKFRAHCAEFHPEFEAKLGDEGMLTLGRANHERSKTLEDPVRSCRFFILEDEEIVIEESKAVREALEKGEPNGYSHLERLQDVLAGVRDWSAAELEHAVKAYAEAHAEGKLGKVAQPLRIAVSGGVVSPAIFDTLAILGKTHTLKRIQQCVKGRTISAA